MYTRYTKPGTSINILIRVLCVFWGGALLICLHTRTVGTIAKVDRARRSGHTRRGLGTILPYFASGVHAVFFSAGEVNKTVSRVFSVRSFFLLFLCFFKGWRFLLICISLRTAGLAINLGSLCRDRFRLHSNSTADALRAVCRAPRVHMPCVMRYFFLGNKNKKTGRGSK